MAGAWYNKQAVIGEGRRGFQRGLEASAKHLEEAAVEYEIGMPDAAFALKHHAAAIRQLPEPGDE